MNSEEIKSLLKEYEVVECTNRLGDTIKAEYLLEEYGELLLLIELAECHLANHN